MGGVTSGRSVLLAVTKYLCNGNRIDIRAFELPEELKKQIPSSPRFVRNQGLVKSSPPQPLHVAPPSRPPPAISSVTFSLLLVYSPGRGNLVGKHSFVPGRRPASEIGCPVVSAQPRSKQL